MVVSFDVLTLKISRHASTHADPKRLIRTDKWKCAGGYKSGFRRRKVHQILSSSKPSKTMMFRTVIPLLLLLIPLLGCAEAMNENIRACGPNLMEVMIMMCPNGFNGIYQKRDSSEYMLLWISESHEIKIFLCFLIVFSDIWLCDGRRGWRRPKWPDELTDGIAAHL